MLLGLRILAGQKPVPCTREKVAVLNLRAQPVESTKSRYLSPAFCRDPCPPKGRSTERDCCFELCSVQAGECCPVTHPSRCKASAFQSIGNLMNNFCKTCRGTGGRGLLAKDCVCGHPRVRTGSESTNLPSPLLNEHPRVIRVAAKVTHSYALIIVS